MGEDNCTTNLTKDSFEDVKSSYWSIQKSRQLKRKISKRLEQAFHKIGYPDDW